MNSEYFSKLDPNLVSVIRKAEGHLEQYRTRLEHTIKKIREHKKDGLRLANINAELTLIERVKVMEEQLQGRFTPLPDGKIGLTPYSMDETQRMPLYNPDYSGSD